MWVPPTPVGQCIAGIQTQGLDMLRQAPYQLNDSPSPGPVLQGCKKWIFLVCTLKVHSPKLGGSLRFSQCSAIAVLNLKWFFQTTIPRFHCALSPSSFVVGLVLVTRTRLSRIITAFINLGSWLGGLGNGSMLLSGKDMTIVVMKAEQQWLPAWSLHCKAEPQVVLRLHLRSQPHTPSWSPVTEAIYPSSLWSQKQLRWWTDCRGTTSIQLLGGSLHTLGVIQWLGSPMPSDMCKSDELIGSPSWTWMELLLWFVIGGWSRMSRHFSRKYNPTGTGEMTQW